jgi:hypothetical protein
MPAVFKGRNATAGPIETPFRVFVGQRSLYGPDGKALYRIGNIPDGTSNTIMAVEAPDAVPWAAPRELNTAEVTTPGQLIARGRREFQVVLLDGSVRTITEHITVTTFRNAIDPADGNVLGPDW